MALCRCSRFDEVCEISFGLDVLLNAEVLRPFLKQRIHHLSGLLFLHDGRGLGHLLPLGLLSFGYLAWLEERERPLSKVLWLIAFFSNCRVHDCLHPMEDIM